MKLSNLDNVVDYAYSGQDYINLVQNSIKEIPVTCEQSLSQHEGDEVAQQNGQNTIPRDSIETKKICEFSLIISDCQMPIVDGYEATTKII